MLCILFYFRYTLSFAIEECRCRLLFSLFVQSRFDGFSEPLSLPDELETVTNEYMSDAFSLLAFLYG